MLFFSMLFFCIAAVAAFAGFAELAPRVAAAARLVCYVSFAIALISLMLGLRRRRFGAGSAD